MNVQPDRQKRLADLVKLRRQVDSEIVAMLPNPARRTAKEWLLMLPADPDAERHREQLDEELAERWGAA